MNPGRPALTTVIASTLLLMLLAASPRLPALAADALVPPAVQAALTLRVLEYDRSLRAWAGESLSIGVVGSRRGGASEYLGGLQGQTVQGLPIVVSTHVYQDVDSLLRWVHAERIRLLYISPELAGEVRSVLSAAKAEKLPSLAATREHFEAGGTLGIVVRDAKPHILVNLPDSRAAGLDLDPKLLQLAEVVR